MEVDEGNRSRRDAPTPCGCSCGWFKTRLTQDQDLIVYQQPLRHVRDKPKTGDVGKNTVVSAIVVQNNGENDVSVQTEAFLTNSDVNEINCPRCKHHVQRARALLKDAFVLKDNNTCVCEMCDLQRLTHVPCLHCENVRKTLKLKDFFVSRKEDLIKQQEKNFLKSILGRRKTENQRRDFRAYSDIHLTDTIERICRHSQSVERPKSAVDSRYEHVLKPGFEPATGHDRSKKPWHRIRDKTDNLKNESLLGLGTTGIMRRYHSEESLRAISSKEEKTFNYIFPRMMKDEKFMFEASAEQLKNIRKRFQTEVEKKIREQEKIKIKKEIKNMIEWAKQRGISLSDLDIITKKGQKEKDIKNMNEWAKRRGITPSEIDVITKQIQKEKDITKLLELTKRKGITLSEIDMMRETVQKDGTKLKKIKDFKKTKDGKYLLDEKERLFKKVKKEKAQDGKEKTQDGKEKAQDGKGLIDKKGRLIKKGKDLVRFNKKSALGQDTRGVPDKSGRGEENEDKGEERKTLYKKDKEKYVKKKVGDAKKNVEDKGTKRHEIRKTEKKKDRGDAKEIKPIEKDEVKQEGEKIKTGTETIEAKGIKGMIEEQKGTKKDRKQKQGKDKDEDKIKEKEDTAVADGEMEKIERDETASPTDKEKIQSEKDASRSKKSPKIDKSTEMHEVESEFVIPPESTAKLIKDLKKRRTSVEGVDEVTLLNEVLTKQENYIAVGKKVKKTKEDLLKYQKLKAKQTATKETEPDDSLQYLDPGANKKKKEKIAPKGGDHKKLKEDKMTVTEKPVAVPIEKIEVPIENIRVQAQDPGDDMLLKMIFKANQKKPAPRDLKKVKVKPIEPLPGLPIPQKRETPTETIATEKSDEDSQLGKEKASQLGKERARDSQLGKERARKSSLDIKPSKPKRELVLGTEIIRAKDAPPEPEPKSVPVFFHTEYNADDVNYTVPTPPTLDEDGKESTGGGPLLYALSDRKFIDNGWTVLPTEKIVRKVNVYRMHPAYPEFDWFELNKKKGTMRYSTGEKLAEVDKNGRGRWYYKNGRLALNYYNCEEPNAQQRYVVYSSGEPDERGRSTPITVLGMFDFNGNGVVFDHGGKIRLKYNQNEGIVLDRSIGPVTQWKWHSLNDPPELQQVMIDSQLDYKDPTIFSYAADHYPPPQDETLLAIEYDNYIKSKEKKKEFKPNQINMKVMKLNDQFTLKVLDQNRIYLLFRDGATTMKCNLGLKIDHSDIVDTTFCDLGEVCVTAEKLPAATDSLADLQKCLKEAQKFNQVRVARELTKTPLLPTLSADRMTAAVSKPPRRPLLTENTGNRTPASGNMTYYNTRLI